MSIKSKNELRFLCLIILSTHIFYLLFGCAGLNPNPGQRTASRFYNAGNYKEANKIFLRNAKEGEPWAQYRLGYSYEFGKGVIKNYRTALFWYKKAAVQEAEGGWAEGKSIGYFGKFGFFDQNSSACGAQYRIGMMYYNGKGLIKDNIKAYLWVHRSLKTCSNGNSYIYEGGQKKTVYSILRRIMNSMSDSEKKRAASIEKRWNPSIGVSEIPIY